MTALPRPLATEGAKAQRWNSHKAKGRVAVFLRVRNENGGRCEGEDCWNQPTDLAHAFSSKGHLVAEPWASSPELCFGLCRSCHRAMDGLNPDFQARMRWIAVVRWAAAERVPMILMADKSPEGAARAIEDWLRSRDSEAV